jgi:hypothetical protein
VPTLWRTGTGGIVRLAAVRSLAIGLVALIVALLVLPLGQSLAAGTLDQSQTERNFFYAGVSTFGQTFTAGITGVLDRADLAICTPNAAALGDVTIGIRPVSGGLPVAGPPLASVTFASTSLPACPSSGLALPFTSVDFARGAWITAGTAYAIVAIGQHSGGTLQMLISNANPYAAGQAVYSFDSGATYGAGGGIDAVFNTYVTQAALSVGGGSVIEGNSGTRNLAFPVFTSLAVGADVTASYALANGTARGGAACAPGIDFVNTGGTVTVTAGSTVGSIVVPVCGDADFEPDEGLTVTLSGPSNAVLGTAQALGTIQNDDAEPATPTPLPAFAAGQTPVASPVRVSVQRAGTDRLLVTIAAVGPITQVTWPTVANVAVETSEGTPITSASLAPPSGSTTAVFYVRKTGGSSAALPLTVTGAFPTWQTFVGGGPSAW